jgi:hypothetical protein
MHKAIQLFYCNKKKYRKSEFYCKLNIEAKNHHIIIIAALGLDYRLSGRICIVLRA